MRLQVKELGGEAQFSPEAAAAERRQQRVDVAPEPDEAEAGRLRVDVAPEPELSCLEAPAVLLDCSPALVACRQALDVARARDVAVAPHLSCRLGLRRQLASHRFRLRGLEVLEVSASRLWLASSVVSSSTSGSTRRRSLR